MEIEPLHIIDPNYLWLIAITSENAPDSGVLCAYIMARQQTV